MKAFATSLLVLAVAMGMGATLRVWAANGWSQPVDISPERDYRIFPDTDDNASRVVFLDLNESDLPGPYDNIRKIKVVEHQGGAWGSEILIGSNGHYVQSGGFEYMPKTTRPVISGDGNTIAYMGYTGVEASPYAIYVSDRGPSGAWSAPAVLPEGAMTTHYGAIGISYDGATLIHSSHPVSWSEDQKTYVSTRQGGVWGNPALVYDGSYGFAYNVTLSADGNRAGFAATNDLYLLERSGEGWAAAVKVVDYEPPSALGVEFPQFTADGTSVFYWEVYCAPTSGGCTLTNQNLKRIHDDGGGWSAPSQVAFSDLPSLGKDGNSPAAIDATGRRAVFPVVRLRVGEFLESTKLVYTDWRDGAWTTPAEITSREYNYLGDYNKQPVLSADGSRLVYSGYLENGSDSKSMTILLSTSDSPLPPIQAQIEPGTGGTLVSPDGRVEINFPPGAVAVSTVVTYTVQQAPSHSPGILVFAGTAFQVTASQAGQPVTEFMKPLTVTIQYYSGQILGLDPGGLALYDWDQAEGRWKDAADTCSPASIYSRLPAQNLLSVGVCHFTEFALMGAGHLVFLPLVWR
jgi:hypothetical protein